MSVSSSYSIPKDYTVPSDYSIPTDANIPKDYRFPGGEVAPVTEKKTTGAAIDNLSLYTIAAAVGIASTAGVALALRERRKKKDNGEVKEKK